MTYDLSAKYYDLIYEAKKDYQAEALRVRELIMAHQQSGGRVLLDVACGTGLHLQYFKQWYYVIGLDNSQSQLAVARQRLPQTYLVQDDMVDFDFGRKFDVITCLFSAIGYLAEPGQLRRAIATMTRHLLPGGLLIVEPWLHPSSFTPGHIGVDVAEKDGVKIVRVGHIQLEGRITNLTEHHWVSRHGAVEYFVEDHQLALYTIAEYLGAFRAAGLTAWHEPEGLMGRGLFIGRK